MLHHLRRCKNSPDKLRQLVAKANGSAAEQVQQLLATLSAEEVAAVGEQNTVGQPLKKLKSLSTEEAETQEAQSESAAAKNTEEQEVPKRESQSAVEKDLEVKQELKTVVKTVATPQNKRKLEAETAASQEKKEPKDTIFYRKEYYKADNKFGFKRFEAGQKPKQIFSCGHAKIPKPELQKLAGKILNDLHKCCGHRPKEEEIELVAKHKVWKMSQSYQGVHQRLQEEKDEQERSWYRTAAKEEDVETEPPSCEEATAPTPAEPAEAPQEATEKAERCEEKKENSPVTAPTPAEPAEVPQEAREKAEGCEEKKENSPVEDPDWGGSNSQEPAERETA
eukprot:symbB.v1.2.012989.t1/scaffold910.1/size153024/3